MPWASKSSRLNGLMPSGRVRSVARRAAWPMGAAHQAWMRLSASVTAMAARPVSAELDRQPLGAGDALGPGQPERPGLELAGDQRGSPEDADDGGGEDDAGDAGQVHGRVDAGGGRIAEEVTGQLPATAAVAAGDPAGGIQAGPDAVR